MTWVTLSKAVAIATIAASSLLAGCVGVAFLSGAPYRTDEQMNRIQRGMTRDDVRRILGLPDETMRFPLSNTESWDYNGRDTWGYTVLFSVTFGADGQAQSTIARRLNDGGDRGGP
jgi:outer membrane protein assembly factor BamE (lipoprotein component of BamABCDE complex)